MRILRDLRGHFAKPADSGEPCPHPCCNGSRAHPPGTPLRVSTRTRRKLDKLAAADAALLAAAQAKETARVAAKAKRARQPAQVRRAADRDNMRLAMHAQDLRAEAYAMGYKTETAGFYGSDKVAQAEVSERRLTVAEVDREDRARAEYEREQAANYAARGPAAGGITDNDYLAWA